MTEPQTLSAYFTYCKLQKNLDNKTLKAYQIDLKQFVDFYPKPTTVTRTDMELFYWIVSIYIFKYIFNYSCTVSRFYLINTAEQNNLSFVIVFKNSL